MAEQSYIFDFSRVPSFFENFNIGFFVDEMTKIIDGETVNEGTECFELVWVAYGDDNISEYLEEDGTLDSSVVIYQTESCGLDWIQDSTGDATIELSDTVEFSVGENNVPLKAILLRNVSTGYIMGYSINMNPFTVTNKLVFDDDVIFWDITRYNNYG